MIIYWSNDEVIVCTRDGEPDVLVDYFGEGKGRSLDEYDREEAGDIVILTSRLRAEW